VGVLVAATLTASALLLVGLSRESLWIDEAYSVNVTASGPSTLLQWLVREMNMSAYYVTLLPVVALSTSEFAVRLPSAIAAITSVPLLFWVVRLAAGVRVAMIAVVLLVANPFFVEYGREARSYSMVLAVALLSTGAFIHAVRGQGRRWWTVWTLAAAAGAYLHYFALLLPAAHLFTGRVTQRIDFGDERVRTAILNLGVLVSPQVFLMLLQRPTAEWIPPLSLERLVHQLGALVGGSWLSLGVGASLALFGITRAWAHERDDERRFSIVLFAAIVALPILVAVLGSLIRPMLVDRYLTPALAGWLSLAAIGIASLRTWLVRTLALLVAVGLMLPAIVDIHRSPQKDDWEGVTAALLANVGPDDRVAIVPPYVSWPIYYYEGRLGQESWNQRPTSRLLPAGILHGQPVGPSDVCQAVRTGALWLVVATPDPGTAFTADELFAMSGLSPREWQPLLSRAPPVGTFRGAQLHVVHGEELCD
jgi:mannosyltransferase